MKYFLENVQIHRFNSHHQQLTGFRLLAGPACRSQQGSVQREHEIMELEEHTGTAKTRVPSKKKEIYQERRIVVCLSGLGLMTVSAGEPEVLYAESVFHWGTTCLQEILQEQ